MSCCVVSNVHMQGYVDESQSKKKFQNCPPNLPSFAFAFAFACVNNKSKPPGKNKHGRDQTRAGKD